MHVVHIAPGVLPIPSVDEAVGVEHDIYALTNHLVRQGCEVSIVDIKAPPSARSRSLASFHEVWNAPLPGRRGLAILPKTLAVAPLMAAALNTLLRRTRVDIVHVHTPYHVLAVRALARLEGRIPLVFTTHAPIVPGPESLRRKIGAAIEGLAFHQADYVIARTRASREQVVARFGIASEKITSIPVAVDTERIEALLAGTRETKPRLKIVLCASRIQPRKNQLTLVHALPAVVSACSDVQFVFTGPREDPAYFRRVQAFVEQHNLSRWVRFMGTLPQEELYRWYRDATIFAFPTLAEMFPQVLVEALGFGLPVVAARIPPVAEIVGQDGGAAILVEPNDVGAYATAIISLLRDAGRRRAMSTRAERIAQRFSCVTVAQETLDHYERWIGSSPRPG